MKMKMQKQICFLSIIPMIITLAVLQFLPDSIPAHYNIEGKVDRIGSKYEVLILPLVILALAVLFYAISRYLYKRAYSSDETRETQEKQIEAFRSNMKVSNLIVLMIMVMLCALQGMILYTSFRSAAEIGSVSAVDIGKITPIMLGILFVIIGNMMPKTRLNSFVGIRISWSMYNETTWSKSNRFGGIAFMIAGIINIIFGILIPSNIGIILMLISIVCVTTATCIYAHQVYKSEIKR